MLKPRLLVLTPRFPYPAIGGDRLRILHICRALKARYTLTLLSLCETRDEMRFVPRDGLFRAIHRVHLPRWRSWLNTLGALPGTRPLQLAYYQSEEFREAVRELAARNDMVLAHLVRTGHYIADGDAGPGIPRILEMTDAISMNYGRVCTSPGAAGWKRFVYRVEQKRLERYERDVVRNFERVWLASDTDRQFLDAKGNSRIDVIPNGVDLRALPYRSPSAGGDVIVFIGNMVTLQNQDACLWFIREVLPQVRAAAAMTAGARVRFRIVGNAPAAVRRRFGRFEGVELTGRIEHIRDGVDGAFCGVCPLRAAAGIQNKVLEYLALGLPCITSPLGLGGIDARPGREVLEYRDADDAARQVLRLHSDQALRTRLAEMGRALVERHYDWDAVYAGFVRSAMDVAAEHAARPRLGPAGRESTAA
jgi:glycosyltransferase involved in cell wall biosynthesis